MEWIRQMDNIKNSAEELVIVIKEIIYLKTIRNFHLSI